MPPNQHLRKVAELWLLTTLPPPYRRLYITIYYANIDHDPYFQINIADSDGNQALAESEIRFIATILDHVSKRLGIPKGENQC